MAKKSLYVGNLPFTSTKGELSHLFEEYGPISDIRISEGKGFAFVDIPEENVEAAVEAVNGKTFNGRILAVREAKPRTEYVDDDGSR